MFAQRSFRLLPVLGLLAVSACDRHDAPLAPSPAHFDGVATQNAESKIAFSRVFKGRLDLYVMNPDGSGLTKLTGLDTTSANDGNNYHASWSPDGSRIAFTSSRWTWLTEVWVMNADGTGVTRLTYSGPSAFSMDPSWCGNQIAFISTMGGQSVQIHAMNSDGTGVTQVTHSSPANDFTPAWSPTCAQIVFSSSRDGNNELYVINADGTGETRLTNDPGQDDWPAWSPDGGRIAFTTNRDGNSEIYTMNADGTGLTRVTNDPGSDKFPAWSPDGSEIIFESNRDGDYELYVVNAAGTGLRRLTSNSVSDEWPAWWGVVQPSASNEPPGFATVTNRAFDAPEEPGWGTTGSLAVVADAGAPQSPQSVGEIDLSGWLGGDDPTHTDLSGLMTNGYTRLYLSFWVKLSSDWQGSPGSGVNTIGYAWMHDSPVVSFAAHGMNDEPLFAELLLTGTAEPGDGTRNLAPNLSNPEVTRGQWHRWEVLLIANTGGLPNGQAHWWIDGVKVGEYTDVSYAGPDQSNVWGDELSWRPSWGNVGDTAPQGMKMWMDHYYVSGKP